MKMESHRANEYRIPARTCYFRYFVNSMSKVWLQNSSIRTHIHTCYFIAHLLASFGARYVSFVTWISADWIILLIIYCSEMDMSKTRWIFAAKCVDLSHLLIIIGVKCRQTSGWCTRACDYVLNMVIKNLHKLSLICVRRGKNCY